jgi:hypothetical protein
MKKALSITLVLIGTALLVTAAIFWIDSNTSVEPESFGKALRDWVTLIAGLGASIKGWLDLLRKDKSAQPTTQIVIQGGNTKIEVGNVTQQKTQLETYSDKYIKNNTNVFEEIKPVLRQFITDALREQELKEVITDYFPSVELNTNSKSSMRELIGELVNNAIYQGKVEHLIGIIKRYNPYQYNNYEKELEKIIRALKADQH